MIVLTILKVIGIILLVFLLLILLILGILLFVPVRYYSDSYKNEDSNDYCLKLYATWLLRALRFNATYDSGGFSMHLRFLWMTLMHSPEDAESADEGDSDISYVSDGNIGSDKPNIEKDDNTNSNSDDTSVVASDIKPGRTEDADIKPESIEDADINPERIEDVDVNQERIEDVDAIHKSDISMRSDDSMKESVIHSEIPVDETAQKDLNKSQSDITGSGHNHSHEDKKQDSGNITFFDKIKAKYNTVTDKILKIAKKLSDIRNMMTDEDNIAAFKLIIKDTKYLLKHYGFRLFKGNFTYGSDDPYSVGQMMTYLSLLYPVYGDDYIIEPVFDRQVLKGKIKFNGHIRLIHLLVAIIDLMLNKTIRQAVVNHFKEDTDG